MNRIPNLTQGDIEHDVSIVNMAPSGATHYAMLQYDMVEVYIKNDDGDIHTLNESGTEWVYRDDIDLNGFLALRDLSDIRTKLALYYRVESLKQPSMTSVKDRLPDRRHKDTSANTMISDTVLVHDEADPLSVGFGHLTEQGNWVVYSGEHDFMNVLNVTHWMAIPKAGEGNS